MGPSNMALVFTEHGQLKVFVVLKIDGALSGVFSTHTDAEDYVKRYVNLMDFRIECWAVVGRQTSTAWDNKYEIYAD